MNKREQSSRYKIIQLQRAYSKRVQIFLKKLQNHFNKVNNLMKQLHIGREYSNILPN